MLTEDTFTKTILKRILPLILIILLVSASAAQARSEEAAAKKILFFCHYSKTVLYEGETVYAEYTLVNTGNVPLKSARFEDSALDYVSAIFSLAPGEEKSISVSRSPTKETDEKPRARFVFEGSDKIHDLIAQDASLSFGSDHVIITVTPEKDTLTLRERAFLTITVTNEGPFRYDSCLLESDVFGRVTDFPVVLMPGAEITRTLETKHLTETAQGAFTLTARNESGDKTTFSSDEISLAVLPGEAKLPAVSVIANEVPGAPFTITVTGSDKALRNVRLTEKNLGLIKEIAYLAANAETVLAPDLDINEGESCTFKIEWTEEGEAKTASAQPVSAAFSTHTDTPSGIAGYTNRAFYAIVHAQGLSGVILYGCLTGISLILILSVIHRLYRRRRAKREAREALGSTNRFTPVRPREGKKEK